jgi:hypothetical protein
MDNNEFLNMEHEKVIFTESGESEQVDMVDEGWHRAKFVRYDVKRNVPLPERYQTEDRKTQDKIVMWFDIDGKHVRRTVNYTWGPKSNAKKLIAGMLGKNVNDRLNMDLDQLLGKESEILITHNTGEDGYVFVNIEKARPIKAAKK